MIDRRWNRNSATAVEQTNDYYAYGGPWGNTSTNQGFQPFKYNGKELDRIHGLDWYDYGARRYDPACAQFTQMDPLCEQYPHLSPYAYCAGNPVRYVDPDGREWITVKYKNDSFFFYDDRIKSQDDISKYYYGGSSSNNWISYYGSEGVVENEKGDIMYYLNEDGSFSDATGSVIKEEVDNSGIHIGNNMMLNQKVSPNNWYGFYLGPNNPTQSNGSYSYALPPIDDLDYAAFLHDRGYDTKKAVGIGGALLNPSVIPEDMNLVMRSLESSYRSKPLSRKFLYSISTAYTFGTLSIFKSYLRRFIK